MSWTSIRMPRMALGISGAEGMQLVMIHATAEHQENAVGLWCNQCRGSAQAVCTTDQMLKLSFLMEATWPLFLNQSQMQKHLVAECRCTCGAEAESHPPKVINPIIQLMVVSKEKREEEVLILNNVSVEPTETKMQAQRTCRIGAALM
ncbi:unnamed protein product [Effrenium voratum]|nr:unnamed protein product [Effrenium voratum]